jgi:RimJ/RimL family protein N-acetyltransferase
MTAANHSNITASSAKNKDSDTPARQQECHKSTDHPYYGGLQYRTRSNNQRRQRLAPAAVRAVLRYGFEQPGLVRIAAGADVPDVVSVDFSTG